MLLLMSYLKSGHKEVNGEWRKAEVLLTHPEAKIVWYGEKHTWQKPSLYFSFEHSDNVEEVERFAKCFSFAAKIMKMNPDRFDWKRTHRVEDKVYYVLVCLNDESQI